MATSGYRQHMKLNKKALLFSIPKLNFGHRTFDKLGMLLSIVCGVHCLVTPFLLLVMPWLSHSFENEIFHVVMLLLVLPVASISLAKGHGFKTRSSKMMIIGVVLLILGVVYHFNEHSHAANHTAQNYIIENLLTISGGVLLTFAHYSKLKSCRSSHIH